MKLNNLLTEEATTPATAISLLDKWLTGVYEENPDPKGIKSDIAHFKDGRYTDKQREWAMAIMMTTFRHGNGFFQHYFESTTTLNLDEGITHLHQAQAHDQLDGPAGNELIKLFEDGTAMIKEGINRLEAATVLSMILEEAVIDAKDEVHKTLGEKIYKKLGLS